MDRKEIEKIIALNEQIIECLENNKIGEAYQKLTIALKLIQEFIMMLLECEVLEQEMAVSLLTDLADGIEQKDSVLLIDTIRYGISALLCQIIEVIEEEESYE